MIKIKNVLEFLNRLAPFDTAESYDNVGLLLGNAETEIKRIGVVLDITGDSILKAENAGIDLIVSHHPVIFYPLKSVDTRSCVYKLTQLGIAAIAAHTNLDNAGIVNKALGEKLGLTNLKPLAGGRGLIGALEAEMPAQDFVKYVKEKLACGGVSYTGSGKIKQVALSSGAGSDDLIPAIQNQADALVTSDVKHNVFTEANEHDFCIVDAGHFHTENVVIPVLSKALETEFPEVSVEIIRQSAPMKSI